MFSRRPPSLAGFVLLAVTDASGGVPFLEILGELDRFLQEAEVIYAIVGGVAAVRAGGARTTGDIDLLVLREAWEELRRRQVADRPFDVGPDWGLHRKTGVPLDVLFAEDDWELPFKMPDPEVVREWDPEVGAWFMEPLRLLELKAAVHESKRREFGEATAARDLEDVRAILAARPELAAPESLESLQPSVRALVARTAGEIEAYRNRKPKKPRRS